MKVVLINASPRRGNTYHAAQLFLEEMAKQTELQCTEYFLPQDLPEFCLGCGNCFDKGEEKCPHAGYTLPILESMLEADALVVATPVFVWQTTGAMKNFLDHFAHLFMIHRPRQEMFGKNAFILSTATGGPKNSAIKPIALNLKLWGINRVYSKGFILNLMHPGSWESIDAKRRDRIEKEINREARKFYKRVNGKKRQPYLLARFIFYLSRSMIVKDGKNRAYDRAYWERKGWLTGMPL